jgi:hypothetical protein
VFWVNPVDFGAPVRLWSRRRQWSRIRRRFRRKWQVLWGSQLRLWTHKGERREASGKRQVARGPARTGAAASSCCRSPRQPPHRTPPVRGPCCRYAAPFSWTHRRPSASSGRFCRLNQADGSTRQGLRRSIWSTWSACEGLVYTPRPASQKPQIYIFFFD